MSSEHSLHRQSLEAELRTHGERAVLKGVYKSGQSNEAQTSPPSHRASALIRYPAPRPPPMGPLPPLPKGPPLPPRRPGQAHTASCSVSSYASFGSSSSGSGSGSSGSSSDDAFLSPVTPPKAVVWQTTALPASDMDWSPDEWTPDDPFELGLTHTSRPQRSQPTHSGSRTSMQIKGSSRTSYGLVPDAMSPAETPKDALGLDLDLLNLFPSPPARPSLRTPTWQQVRHTSGGTVLPPRSSSLASSSLSLALRPPSMSFSRMQLAHEPVDDDGRTIIVRSERSGSDSNEVECRWSGTFEDVFMTEGRRSRPEAQTKMSEADKIRAAYLAGRA